MEQDHYSDAPRKKYEQRDRELNIIRNFDTRISPGEARSEWTGGDAREHGEPTIRNGQRTLVHEEHEAAETRDKCPHPRH